MSDTNYGIQVNGLSGQNIINQNGLLQVWEDTVSNYCQKTTTTNYPLYLYIYLPKNLLEINKFTLRIYTNDFKHYIKSMQPRTISLHTNADKSHQHINNTFSLGMHSSTGTYTPRSVDGHSYNDGYVTNTAAHTHPVSVTIREGGAHSHEAIPHFHLLNPGISVISTPAVTNITGTITQIATGYNRTIIFNKKSVDYFVNTTNIINNFFNNVSVLFGWYRLTLQFTNNTTKRMTASYSIEGMGGVNIT